MIKFQEASSIFKIQINSKSFHICQIIIPKNVEASVNNDGENLRKFVVVTFKTTQYIA